MARSTRAAAIDLGPGRLGIVQLLATLASATNPDGTPFTLPIQTGVVVAADILCGRIATTATTGATTLITIPAGRIWVGTIGASVALSIAAGTTAAGQATAQISVAGTDAAPTPGIYLGVDARVGAPLATSTAGAQSSNFGSASITAVAPAGNAITIQVATTNVGTSALVDTFALGKLL